MPLPTLEHAAQKIRVPITRKLEALEKNMEQSAYDSSLVLLISAQLGNPELYQKVLKNMVLQMRELKEDPFKAWLYARMVYAAHHFGKLTTNDQETKDLLGKALTTLLTKDETRFHPCTAWAIGYLTASDSTEYNTQLNYSTLQDIAQHLTQKLLVTPYPSEEEKQTARSDALWTWVMIAQAAANGNDTPSYNDALTQMMKITRQDNIANALSTGLLRAAASNDYPAWAIGMLLNAATKIGDQESVVSLQTALTKSLETANPKGAESILANINQALAKSLGPVIENKNDNDAPPGLTPTN